MSSTFAGKRGGFPPGGGGPDARRGKKKHPGAPFRGRTRKIAFYLLLGLIYFVKVK